MSLGLFDRRLELLAMRWLGFKRDMQEVGKHASQPSAIPFPPRQSLVVTFELQMIRRVAVVVRQVTVALSLRFLLLIQTLLEYEHM